MHGHQNHIRKVKKNHEHLLNLSLHYKNRIIWSCDVDEVVNIDEKGKVEDAKWEVRNIAKFYQQH